MYTLTFGTVEVTEVPQSREGVIELAEILDCNNGEHVEITAWENDRAIYKLNGTLG